MEKKSNNNIFCGNINIIINKKDATKNEGRVIVLSLYKPSNFYPDLTEVDFQDPNGAEFECKVHTNGSQVKAYKLNILSEDGVPLYESYHNLDSPLDDGEYLQALVKHYKVNLSPYYTSATGEQTQYFQGIAILKNNIQNISIKVLDKLNYEIDEDEEYKNIRIVGDNIFPIFDEYNENNKKLNPYVNSS